MVKYLGILLVSICLRLSAYAADVPVSEYLQSISVTVKAENHEGSGVVFTRKDYLGQPVNLVWTAGHVVEGLRSTRNVIAPDGTTKTKVEFQDVIIIKEILEDGRRVGKTELDAEVIRYSDPDTGEDLAVLRVRKKSFFDATGRFYSDKNPPALGTELYHVGSLLGEMGSNSMTTGNYSQYGRMIGKIVFDQTSVVAFPGSSGGGVFLKDGQYVGMLVRSAGPNFNLIVPVRRIRKWATTAKIEWAIDPAIPMPNDEAIGATPVEVSK